MHTRLFLSVIAVFISLLQAQAQFDPNAGVIFPFTQNASIATSSPGSGNPQAVIDGDNSTFWQSDAPFPTNYISRSDQNILLDFATTGNFSQSGGSNTGAVTDGDANSSQAINAATSGAWAKFEFDEPTNLHTFSIKYQTNYNLKVFAFYATGDSVCSATLYSGENFNLQRFVVDLQDVTAIKLYSTDNFGIFEFAVLSGLPQEYVIVDMGSVYNVAWFNARLWNDPSSVETSSIWLSTDGVNWNKAVEQNPQIVPMVSSVLDTPVSARYIKMVHEIAATDWKKAFFWELAAYDAYGPYGTMPHPLPRDFTIADMLGVNGIWGWGNDVYSDALPSGEGPELYARIGKWARNYHSMGWDISDPDHIPDYANMAAGNGTEALWWLDWDREYETWDNAGISTQMTIKFNNNSQPMSVWDSPYDAGYNYAYAFAQHFGPTYGNGFCKAFEAGNEPWDYSAAFYLQVLEGMANGIKDADPNILFMPCALQSAFPSSETAASGNFSGARMNEATAQLSDVFNGHYYSYVHDDAGIRRGVHPEHRQSTFRGLLNDLRFAEANMPGKPVWITEWGWDSDGAGEDCTHGECVGESAQAMYGVRAALIMARLGVERANWYFYANLEGPGSLYARAGLTGSPTTDFAPKKSFKAFEALLHHMGDKRFLNVLREDDQAWVYSFGGEDGVPTHIVVWRPVSEEEDAELLISFAAESIPVAAYQLDGTNATGTVVPTPVYNPKSGKMLCAASAKPIIIELNGNKRFFGRGMLNPIIFDIRQGMDFIPDGVADQGYMQVTLPTSGRVVLKVYDINGKPVGEPLTGNYPNGINKIPWSYPNLPSGVYIGEMELFTQANPHSATSAYSKMFVLP